MNNNEVIDNYYKADYITLLFILQFVEEPFMVTYLVWFTSPEMLSKKLCTLIMYELGSHILI